MNRLTKDNILIVSLVISVIIGITSLAIGFSNNDSKTYTIKNNSTRDYEFEHYCDSIYESDPDYYLEVLVETDKFQNYIEEHGEWWTN